jgi:hypothetical protein
MVVLASSRECPLISDPNCKGRVWFSGGEAVAAPNCSVALPMTMQWSMRSTEVRWLRARWKRERGMVDGDERSSQSLTHNDGFAVWRRKGKAALGSKRLFRFLVALQLCSVGSRLMRWGRTEKEIKGWGFQMRRDVSGRVKAPCTPAWPLGRLRVCRTCAATCCAC